MYSVGMRAGSLEVIHQSLAHHFHRSGILRGQSQGQWASRAVISPTTGSLEVSGLANPSPVVCLGLRRLVLGQSRG
jgi:hypothetical protein